MFSEKGGFPKVIDANLTVIPAHAGIYLLIATRLKSILYAFTRIASTKDSGILPQEYFLAFAQGAHRFSRNDRPQMTFETPPFCAVTVTFVILYIKQIKQEKDYNLFISSSDCLS